MLVLPLPCRKSSSGSLCRGDLKVTDDLHMCPPSATLFHGVFFQFLMSLGTVEASETCLFRAFLHPDESTRTAKPGFRRLTADQRCKRLARSRLQTRRAAVEPRSTCVLTCTPVNTEEKQFSSSMRHALQWEFGTEKCESKRVARQFRTLKREHFVKVVVVESIGTVCTGSSQTGEPVLRCATTSCAAFFAHDDLQP